MKTLGIGEIINKTYEVCFYIGEGAFGEVYRVRHKFFNELQVLKVFKKEIVQNISLDQVINEGKILAKLNHPNVVRVFEINSFTKNDIVYYFITMSFISGESLSQLIKRKIQLDMPVAISIILDALKGLNAAHKNNPPIIHRDINPDNILLSYDNIKPKGILGDFGISSFLEINKKMVGAGGRYMYFAPECFMDIYLPSSDVFSMGLVLYKSLTGVHPWEYNINVLQSDKQEEILGMVNKIRKATPKSSRFYNSTISPKLDAIIMKAIEKNINERFRNAQSFIDSLKELDITNNISTKYWKEAKIFNNEVCHG